MSEDATLLATAPPLAEMTLPHQQALTHAAAASGRYGWSDYGDLPLEAVAYLPLQRISLFDLARVVPGTIFRSSHHFTEDLFLRVGSTFMASVSLEAAGASRGIRISNFDDRVQNFPAVAASNLAPPGDRPLAEEAQNLRSCTVPLTLCFGTRTLSLKNALLLAPGQLLSMKAPLQQPVSLLVHDRVVAYGTPMLHSNFYSVLVTELARPGITH